MKHFKENIGKSSAFTGEKHLLPFLENKQHPRAQGRI